MNKWVVNSLSPTTAAYRNLALIIAKYFKSEIDGNCFEVTAERYRRVACFGTKNTPQHHNSDSQVPCSSSTVLHCRYHTSNRILPRTKSDSGTNRYQI